MEFRNIENKDLVNLENCESEPIHIPGSIQPHGFLIAVAKENNVITFCSENVSEFINVTYKQLLGKNISVIFNGNIPDGFSEYLQSLPEDAAPFKLQIDDRKLDCVFSISDDSVILEFEPVPDIQPDINSLYLQTRQFVKIIQQANSLQNLCQRVADETREITGYDRVMVYRFDKDYNGEVFAESRKENIEPFLGLHYPHTDIPPQARELYIRNLLRMIVNVNYKPVPLFTSENNKEKNLDLSLASLRSVSPIHVQYLNNMGVAGTLTISLLHEGKLWGLIACHHYEVKHIDHETRLKAKLQGHFLTSQIKVIEGYEEYDSSKEIDKNLQVLYLELIDLNRKRLDALIKNSALTDIAHASGVAIIIDGEVYSNGIVPSADEIIDLSKWAISFNNKNEFFTDNLSSVYPDAKKINEFAAGIIFHSLGINNNSILWFRQETVREVNWAGDPQKAILKDENGLHPRKSFSLWKQSVKDRSNQWLKTEINAAVNFSNALERQLHLMFIVEEEQKYRELSAKLQQANAELENLNWIGTHDLKEPLRKIQMFASRILDASENIPENVVSGVTRMNDSAARMQSLISDILSYSRAVNAKQGFVPVSLNELLQNVKEELKDDLKEKNAVLEIEPLPEVKAINFFLNQLFVNLIGNSLKFIKADVQPVIKISANKNTVSFSHPSVTEGKKFQEIILEDNGIGFSNDYNESIFNVFTRLHTRDTYSGTGIGLALCKKIMENHGGFITAHGEEGKGATFRLYFPV